jgi:hypothetical protein
MWWWGVMGDGDGDGDLCFVFVLQDPPPHPSPKTKDSDAILPWFSCVFCLWFGLCIALFHSIVCLFS